jgi:hypothetical protein
MNDSILRKFDYWLILITAVFTWAMSVYVAQPWGDNYAYQKISDYLSLFYMMLWETSPFALVAFLLRYSFKNKITIIIFSLGIFIILLLSAFILIDTNFIHLDAQGGLVFLFLPFYQWIAILVLLTICLIVQRVMKHFTKKAAEADVQ